MRSLMLGLLLLAASPLWAQTPEPEVDQAAVLRLGDMVQHVGDGIEAGPDDSFVAAMAPPENDAEKWFVSVLTRQRCSGCEQLKKDWQTDENLLALANPNDPKKSWAHYNVYSRDDRSQAWRFENLRVTVYPTVIVQPPRSGKYGDAKTVVYQGVYQGDPKELAQEITRAIRLYVSKLPRNAQDPSHPAAATVGVDPPWQPAPKDDPLAPLDRPSERPLRIPPEEAYGTPWARYIESLVKYFVAALIVAGGTTAGVLGVVGGVRYARRTIARNQEIRDELATLQQARRRTPRRRKKVPANG